MYEGSNLEMNQKKEKYHALPEWFLKKCKEEDYFEYNDVKKFAQNDPIVMGEIFEHIRCWGKKIAAVYANCQSEYISALLRTNEEFKKTYIVCLFPWIQKIAEEKEVGFSSDYMKWIDLFIYQNVSLDNIFGEKLATEEYVLPLLNQDAKRVSIPFVYFTGYFPQHISNRRNDDTRRGEGHTPYGDKKIQTLVEQGKNIDAVVSELSSDRLYDKRELEENVANSFYELRKREKKCDVMISDVIEKFYKDKYLFFSPSHPTNFCLKFVAERILEKLNFHNTKVFHEGLKENDTVEMFIYPSVKRKLGLTFPKNKFVFNRTVGGADDIKQYVEKYIEYNFPERKHATAVDFRTIDVDYMVDLDEEMVSERKPKVLLLNGRSLHLNLYLTTEIDALEGIFMRIPETYAPRRSMIFMANVFGRGIFPVTIRTNGEGYGTFPGKKGQVILIDATWYMK